MNTRRRGDVIMKYKRQRRHSLSLGRLVGGRGEGGASWTTRGTKRNETRREAAVWSGLVVPTPQSGAGSRKLLSYAPYCLCILLLTFFCAGDGERAEQGEGRKEGGVERTGETFSVRPTQQHPFLSHLHPHQLKPFTHALSGHPLDLNAPFAPLPLLPATTNSQHSCSPPRHCGCLSNLDCRCLLLLNRPFKLPFTDNQT